MELVYYINKYNYYKVYLLYFIVYGKNEYFSIIDFDYRYYNALHNLLLLSYYNYNNYNYLSYPRAYGTYIYKFDRYDILNFYCTNKRFSQVHISRIFKYDALECVKTIIKFNKMTIVKTANKAIKYNSTKIIKYINSI